MNICFNVFGFYGNGETKFRKKNFFGSRRFKNCPAGWKWSDFDDCHRNSAYFLQNEHKRSVEHERAPKRPTDTSEVNSVQQNCPRCFGERLRPWREELVHITDLSVVKCRPGVGEKLFGLP